MSARERVVRPAHISESLQVKMVHAIEDTTVIMGYSPAEWRYTKVSKSSISVPELQKMLGLKRGAAYYLVRQGLFETVTVGGKIRVKLDSFETWYNGQFH